MRFFASLRMTVIFSAIVIADPSTTVVLSSATGWPRAKDLIPQSFDTLKSMVSSEKAPATHPS